MHPPTEILNRPCFTCAHFRELDGAGYAALCSLESRAIVQATPESGCSAWRLNAAADPAVTTREAWIAVHGMPLPGFLASDVQRMSTPLQSRQIQHAWAVQRTPETRALINEIARLRNALAATREALSYISSTAMPQQSRVYVERLSEVIEPMIGARPRTKHNHG